MTGRSTTGPDDLDPDEVAALGGLRWLTRPDSPGTTTTAVADRTGIPWPRAGDALTRLKGRGLVAFPRYVGDAVEPVVELTPAGWRHAVPDLLREPVASWLVDLAYDDSDDADTITASVLRDGTGPAAPARTRSVETGVHRLAAIRFLLDWAPDGLTPLIVQRAAAEIGRPLDLPALVAASAGEADADRLAWDGELPQAWVRLQLDVAPALTHVPWELASLPSGSGARGDVVSIVRRGRGRAPSPPPVVAAGAAAAVVPLFSPDPREHADLVEEAAGLRRDIDATVDAPVPLRASTGDDAEPCRTLADLQRTVAGAEIVHVVGHGSPGELALSGGDDRRRLPEVLGGCRPAVVVLGSCFGATTYGAVQRGRSLAADVVAAGATCVVAFDGLVAADAERAFSRQFYRTLVRTGSVDLAVLAGRRAVRRDSPATLASGLVTLHV